MSDADAWIASLEDLIAKKRLIKQGAMQELLTPPSTSSGQAVEGWEVKKLGEVCEYRNGKSLENHISQNGKYNVITLNSIDIRGKLKSIHWKTNYYDNSIKRGDIVMVLSDVAHGNFLGLSAIIPTDNFVLNQRMGCLHNFQNLDAKFLSLTINYNQQYFKLSGKGSSQLNLGKQDILNFDFHFPSLTEQTRIATILSDMDTEIEQLEQKLTKARQIKHGMMQELLTGRVRLI